MIDLDAVPATFDAAVAALVAGISDEDKRDIIGGASFSHFGAGLYLRNAWSLWETGTPFDLDFRARFGLSHGDDKSGLLLAAVQATIRGDDVDAVLKQEVDRYRNHWLSYGVDPLTMSPLADGRP